MKIAYKIFEIDDSHQMTRRESIYYNYQRYVLSNPELEDNWVDEKYSSFDEALKCLEQNAKPGREYTIIPIITKPHFDED